MEILNKIVVVVKGRKIRVKHILFVILIMLLLFSLKYCSDGKKPDENSNGKISEQEKQKQKEEAIKGVCEFSKRNIVDLNDLLSSSDLCSAIWFEQYDQFISRIYSQNELLEQDSELYVVQVQLLEALEAFKHKQSEANIDNLERALQEYKYYTEQGCK